MMIPRRCWPWPPGCLKASYRGFRGEASLHRRGLPSTKCIRVERNREPPSHRANERRYSRRAQQREATPSLPTLSSSSNTGWNASRGSDARQSDSLTLDGSRGSDARQLDSLTLPPAPSSQLQAAHGQQQPLTYTLSTSSPPESQAWIDSIDIDELPNNHDPAPTRDSAKGKSVLTPPDIDEGNIVAPGSKDQLGSRTH
ncbi:hypothetical protein ACP70R_034483 [Stipagrostis hirtigluma subsp. patula]